MRKGWEGEVKNCEQCGADISDRHWLTRFCWPCARERNKASTAKYLRTNPKARRHDAIRRITKTAIRAGFLQNPKELSCSDCGRPAECYDHRDYNKPLEVEPVCVRCNSSRGAGIELDRELFA